MVRAENPFQLLYVSQLAPGCTWEVVKEIVAAARKHNAAHGITGALLFDGERFCQLIEGAESKVRALANNIWADPRHTALRLLFAGLSPIGQTTQRWVSGYCDAHELEGLDVEADTSDPRTLDGFLAVLQGADVE